MMSRNNNADSGYPNAKRQRKDGHGGFQPKPSYVVHARNLVDNITESEVYDALEKYGQINEIFLLPKKRQALVEFDDIDSAMASVDESNDQGIFIGGVQCYLNFSTSQKIIKSTYDNQQDEKRVLNVNVLNPLYPITINVMQTVCNSFGKILRILIFRKNGVQVMIEFESGDAAARAKDDLDGADIYAGCCTLNIEFAKSNRLTVTNNDADGYDFTLNDSQNNNNNKSNGDRSKNLSSLMSLTETNFHPNESTQQQSQVLGGQIVLSAHNLCPDHFNCDRLFNLLSLYGNVDKIKFLLSKEGSAMLQMSNAKPLYDAITHLNNTYIFGRKIQVHVGKQTVLQPVAKPINLKDDTTSYKEYISNRNNRYQTIEAAQKNKPLPPSTVLYWYNAPPGFTEDQILNVFEGAGAILPSKVKIFPKKIDKSSTGLVEWNSISDCVEALVLTNHTEINHASSKFPYIFKLCFSGTPISRENNNSSKRVYDNYDNDVDEAD